MRYTSISYKRIWQIALPIILGSIAQNLINVTDTAFLGRLGEVALGASAIGGLFYFVFIMLGYGFGIGTQIIVARRYGERNYKDIGPVIEHALYFLIPSAIMLFIMFRIYAPGLLSHLLSSDEILKASTLFLDYRAWGIFFAFINICFRAFYVGIGKTAVITWSTAAMALVNIFLDYSLIFGKNHFPEMGIAGAALASVIAEAFASLFFIGFTVFRVRLNDFGLFSFSRPVIALFKRILTIAFPVMVQNFVSIAGWYIFFLAVEHMGEHELAVSNIIRSIYIVLMIPVFGFAATTNTLVSYLIGKGRPREVFPLIRKIVILSILSVSIIVGLNMIVPGAILSLYTENPILLANTKKVLYVVSIAAIMLSVGFVIFNAVSGTGNTIASLLIELIIIFMYLLITFLFVYVMKAPIEVVWSVEFVYGVLLAFLSWLYLKKFKWQGKKL